MPAPVRPHRRARSRLCADGALRQQRQRADYRLDHRGGRPVRLAHDGPRPLTRRADEQTAATRGLRRRPQACQAAPNWSGWGNGFGGAQWLNAEAASGAPAAQQTIGGGAFGGDYRIGPQTVVGAAVGLSGSNYWVGDHRRQRTATGAHFGIYGLHDMKASTSTPRWPTAASTATRPASSPASARSETAKSSAVSSQLAGRIEVGRPFERAPSPTAAKSASRRSSPCSRPSSGRRHAEVELAQPAVPASSRSTTSRRATTSLPTFLGAQLDAETSSTRGR